MSEDKLDQAVFKIFSMTHQGELHWEKKPVPHLWEQNTDSIYPVYFEADYRGRRLALFQERFRSQIGRGGQDGWTSRTRLALLGSKAEMLYEFPWSRQVQGLFDAVRYKEANVEGFLDDLLNTETLDVK